MIATTGVVAAPTTKEVHRQEYNYALGHLRAFLVLLVIAHHAMLAYHPFAPGRPRSLVAQPRLWQAFPVVDPQRWSGASLLVGFNDVFFMSLLFFLSGLFVWQGIERKSMRGFLTGRLLRLGVPFLIAAAILAPLAYYPTYLQTEGHTGIAGFCRQWLALGSWPAGPAWFIWVLLVFDCIAVLLFAVAPRWSHLVTQFLSRCAGRPFQAFGALVLISGIAYVPMAMVFTPSAWAMAGPFVFQTSRILHYLVYFLIGVVVGKWGVDRGLLSSSGKLAQRWPPWATGSVISFAIAAAITIVTMTSQAKSPVWNFAMDWGFVVSCAASSFAFLAIFLRFSQMRIGVIENLVSNSYAIYLLHYAVVSWLQYSLVSAPLTGLTKASGVFIGALALSWGLAATLRRIPVVRSVV